MKIIDGLLVIALSILCTFTSAADYDAMIELPDPIELSLPVSGVIKTLEVVAGQYVKQGEKMLTLDQVPFQAAKVHAESRVAVQQTLLVESLRDFSNRQELFDRTVLSTVRLENSELKVKRDKAFLKSAEAQLAVANYDLSYSRLSAPFDALVLFVSVNQGQSINNAIESKTLIALVRRGRYLARFMVSAEAYNGLQIGRSVTVKTQGNIYQGSISSIAFELVRTEGVQRKSYLIDAAFSSDEQLLLIGDKASVHIN
ncbi:MAG: hypothetical protein COA54_03670 [Thiotrichaceae bacterium]|nr:MAG: hypothetical protein COA54_03670 [Thiotrichaceae bacterium]